MKKLSPTTRLTIGAMTTALGVLFMYASSIVPSGKLVLLFLASLVVWIPLNERGGIAAAAVCFLATALLSLLLIPNKQNGQRDLIEANLSSFSSLMR